MHRVLVWTIVMSALLGAEALRWHTSLQKARQESARTHRPLAVLVVGRYCGWCRKLEREVLHDEFVKHRLSRYVTVKVFNDDLLAMKQLPTIEMVPTLFVFTPKQRLADTIVGYYPLEDFINLLPEAEEIK